jgi:hypothetical protein
MPCPACLSNALTPLPSNLAPLVICAIPSPIRSPACLPRGIPDVHHAQCTSLALHPQHHCHPYSACPSHLSSCPPAQCPCPGKEDDVFLLPCPCSFTAYAPVLSCLAPTAQIPALLLFHALLMCPIQRAHHWLYEYHGCQCTAVHSARPFVPVPSAHAPC